MAESSGGPRPEWSVPLLREGVDANLDIDSMSPKDQSWRSIVEAEMVVFPLGRRFHLAKAPRESGSAALYKGILIEYARRTEGMA